MNKEEKATMLVHDKECMTCSKIFMCVGKPFDVKRCVNYKEREKKNNV